MKALSQCSHKLRRGFTLVEVCLAMGVMAFAVTAIVGLLTTGLTQLSGSMDSTQGQNILRQVLLEARQLPYPQLAAMSSYNRYFTYEGDMYNTPSAQSDYTAKVTVANPPQVPGATAPSNTLLTLTVEIRKTPGGIDAPANKAIAHYVSMVSCRDLTLITSGS